MYLQIYRETLTVSTVLALMFPRCELMTSGLNQIFSIFFPFFFALLLKLASISGTLKLKIHPTENYLEIDQFVG